MSFSQHEKKLLDIDKRRNTKRFHGLSKGSLAARLAIEERRDTKKINDDFSLSENDPHDTTIRFYRA